MEPFHRPGDMETWGPGSSFPLRASPSWAPPSALPGVAGAILGMLRVAGLGRAAAPSQATGGEGPGLTDPCLGFPRSSGAWARARLHPSRSCRQGRR